MQQSVNDKSANMNMNMNLNNREYLNKIIRILNEKYNNNNNSVDWNEVGNTYSTLTNTSTSTISTPLTPLQSSNYFEDDVL